MTNSINEKALAEAARLEKQIEDTERELEGLLISMTDWQIEMYESMTGEPVSAEIKAKREEAKQCKQ